MLICFTGIDGSGKTLQARELVARLEQAGHPARYVWTGGRAYLTRPLIWLAKRLLRAPRLERTAADAGPPPDAAAQYRAYLRSTGRMLRRRPVRAVWRLISLIEHTAEILVVALPHLLRGRIVVCDRYIYDSLIGIAVLAGSAPAELPTALRLPRFWPVPRPDLRFLIDLPAEVAFGRRTDVVDVAFLERRVPLYQAMATALDARVVDGTATPEAVANEVWQAVRPELFAATSRAVS